MTGSTWIAITKEGSFGTNGTTVHSEISLTMKYLNMDPGKGRIEGATVELLPSSSRTRLFISDVE